MANIHVSRGQEKLGVFSEEEIKEGLQSGRFNPTDLGWREGMSNWSTLSQFPEFAAAGAVVTAAGTTTTPAGTGLPWENRTELGFLSAFFETLKLILLNPATAFANMRKEGGLGDPLLYAVLGGSAGFIMSVIWNVLLGSMGGWSERNPIAGMLGAGIGVVVCIILAPLFIAICVFIGAAILHLCLMLVGGANRSFETTFRVVSYAVGSTNVLAIIPFCGGAIAAIWNIVLECIGLAKAHDTSTAKAVAAVFLPLVVCCGGGLVLAIMFGVLGALTGHH
jgi:hypothetical protein